MSPVGIQRLLYFQQSLIENTPSPAHTAYLILTQNSNYLTTQLSPPRRYNKQGSLWGTNRNFMYNVD
jgi:hypothetical protein